MRRGEGPRDDVTVIVLRVAPEGTAAARRAAGIGERRPRASPRKAMSGMSLLSRGRRSLSFNNSSPPSSNGSDDGLPLPPPSIPAALSVPRGSSLDRSGYSETSDAPTISADSPVLKAYDSEDRSTDASVKGGTLCLDALAEEAKALADEVNAALQTSADHLETAPTSSATTSAPTSGAASAGHSPNLSRTYEVTPPLEVTSPARLATPPPSSPPPRIPSAGFPPSDGRPPQRPKSLSRPCPSPDPTPVLFSRPAPLHGEDYVWRSCDASPHVCPLCAARPDE